MLFKSTLFSVFVLSFLLTFVSAVPTKIVPRKKGSPRASSQTCTYSCPSSTSGLFGSQKLTSYSTSSFLGVSYLTCYYNYASICTYYTSGSEAGDSSSLSSILSSCPSSATKSCSSSKRSINEDTETDMQQRIRKRQWSVAKARAAAAKKE